MPTLPPSDGIYTPPYHSAAEIEVQEESQRKADKAEADRKAKIEARYTRGNGLEFNGDVETYVKRLGLVGQIVSVWTITFSESGKYLSEQKNRMTDQFNLSGNTISWMHGSNLESEQLDRPLVGIEKDQAGVERMVLKYVPVDDASRIVVQVIQKSPYGGR